MSAVLEVDGLTVEHAGRTASVTLVEDVSLSVAAGEILGIVGESGAGKSVTGVAVLGLLDPPLRKAAGRISLEGRRIDELPEAQMRKLRGRSIGAVFQDPMTSLNPLIPIGRQITQTITTHLPMSGIEARKRALELLQEVGIPAAGQRLEAYPHELSGGMRQRVVLALAFACNPRLIIADEPTTALDVSIQAQVIALLRRMCTEHGTAAMLITHDIGVLANCADRVGVLYAGRLVESGPACVILREPRHPYTRGLIASVPSVSRRTEWLPQIDGSMPRPGARLPGCAFAPRCPVRLDRCANERPPFAERRAGHAAACWHPEANRP